MSWSLWLTPHPSSHPLPDALRSLIKTTIPLGLPHAAPLPTFSPHLTLTSGIDPSRIPDPQAWLDGLHLPADQPSVRFASLVNGNQFFKKVFIRCEKEGALVRLATACRAGAVEGGDESRVEEWVKGFDPHVSLVYSDVEVKEEEMELVKRDLKEAGVGFQEKEGAMSGWKGGIVVLVATNKPIEEWEVVAERLMGE